MPSHRKSTSFADFGGMNSLVMQFITKKLCISKVCCKRILYLDQNENKWSKFCSFEAKLICLVNLKRTLSLEFFEKKKYFID